MNANQSKRKIAENKSRSLLAIALFSAIILAGVYASWLRFSQGLGLTTNLSDKLPWGLWVWLDLGIIAFSSCGFIFCAAYFVFHIESIKPLVRPAVLIAFIGYTMAGLLLIYDLGLPQHFWHPITMWNFHSPMFEISWCLMLYATVLALEITIPVTEGLGLFSLNSFLHKFCAVLASAGVILSLLHQSSFGTLFVITPERLHPIWYSTWLPYLFLFSAPIGGISFLSILLFLAEDRAGKILNSNLVKILSRALSVVLVFYLALLIADFFKNHKWHLLIQEPKVAGWFSLEILFTIFLPLIILRLPRLKDQRFGLFLSSFLAVFGIALNRLNVVVIGYILENKTFYIPTWQEWSIALMVFIFSVLLIQLIARLFPIFQANAYK